MLMYYYSYSLIGLFFSGLFVYVSSYRHFLLMLLSLEFMVLSVYMLMFMYFIQFYSEYFVALIYLSFSVCEGALGLSLLVYMIRSYGSDYLFLLDNLW
uniref:NADH-ubiquinone oxidoreductase chain 4L n=1 Tax=Polygraphus poligraphus TaxID=516982 RepID=A0A8F5A439_9CUCU|nr:NADH dehydrogenase subunit 4L [Polygraphus poligraphus]QXG82900.1 NADH dehydrogenase subunit 4L [Polygraphus poligraphus]UJX85657.1 NADH dehydrogenase subunit 4L [Polygraphus poligraphus]